jgi:RNA polymerase sigma-70 factor (ECF subfamily)
MRLVRLRVRNLPAAQTTLNVRQVEAMTSEDTPSPAEPSPGQLTQTTQAARDIQFEEAVDLYGAALERLARAWEADPETRLDLLQEIHIALWRSFEAFDGRCSLRTWVYRVAHNTASSHVTRQMRIRKLEFVGIEELSEVPDPAAGQEAHSDQIAILYAMIHQLKPLDRQVMLAYLEGLDAASTAEITGLSAGNVATKIHRIKQLLADRLNPAATQKGGAR